MPEPTVSVIIPTHDRRHLLEQCLETVRAQTYPHHEIIVVDDASQDGTWEWLQGPGGEGVRSIRLETNSGSTVTRNAGLRAAAGELCLFFDDDDLLPRDALAKHVAAIAGRQEVIATLGSLRTFDASGPLVTVKPTDAPRLHAHIWRDIVFWWGFMVGASVFRTSVLRQVGGFDESLFFFGDDIDLWLRIGHLGPVALLPDVVIEQRQHGQSRPVDFYKVLARISDSRTERWGPDRLATARRIIRARTALDAVKLHRGGIGNLVRIPRLLLRTLRCPYLLTSPISGGEIRRTLRRDVPFSWMRRLRRALR